MQDFLIAFVNTFKSIYGVLLLVGAGYVLARMKLLTIPAARTLAVVLTSFTLPCMALEKFLTGFSPSLVTGWYWLPISAVGVIAIGIAVALPVGMAVARPKLREFTAIGSLNNAGYVPLAMAQLLFDDPAFRDHFQMLIMIYVLGMSPLLWSLGVRLIGRSREVDRLHKAVLNPMFLTICFCLLMCLTGLNRPFLPVEAADGPMRAGPWAWVLKPAQIAGGATIPLALLVLGASLAHVPKGTKLQWRSMLAVAAVRLMIVPAIVVPVALVLPLPWEIRYVICLESCMPPATALAVQARRFEGDSDWVGHHMAICYVAAALTAPVVLSILKMVR